jgi:L,D-peptidoglycan transpeptidase YkuD (ErfK/YbiS/YcfS/YnhG family)
MPTRTSLIAVALAATTLAGCAAAPAAANHPAIPVALTRTGSDAGHTAPQALNQLPQKLPGLGPGTLAQIPADANQVVIVTGTGIDANTSTVVLYQRTEDGWQAGPSWAAHNGFAGWSAQHVNNDLRSPIGVFGLTDAGGLLADPGSKLPYHQGNGFAIGGTGLDGEPLAGAFDYVIAINYNRVPGRNPLDWTMPMGARRGGQIWFHVDHGGPTHGCVSLPAADMITLLRTLDPAQNPVVVMGDSGSLSR